MTAAHATLPDLDALNPSELKAPIVSQHEVIVSRDSEIEQLKLLIAKLRRMQFGRSSEKLDWQIEQLELRLEALVAAEALERIGALYAVESKINGRSPEGRREVRNTRSRPLLGSLKQWLEETLVKLSEQRS
jgi:hypothetical protein